MINWRGGAFNRGVNYSIKGFFNQYHSITTATVSIVGYHKMEVSIQNAFSATITAQNGHVGVITSTNE